MMLDEKPDLAATHKLANNHKWLADVSSLCIVLIQVCPKHLLGNW